MALTLPFANRIKDNLVYIREQGIQFDGKDGVGSEDIILDATTHYSKSWKGKATENPVGDKTDRADHYRTYSPNLSFRGVISEDAVGLYPWIKSIGENRLVSMVERLEKLVKDKKLIEVYMPDGLATDNCVITSLEIRRDTNWSNGFYVNISLKQIQLVTGVTTSTPAPEDADLTAGETNTGIKTGRDWTKNQRSNADLTLPEKSRILATNILQN